MVKKNLTEEEQQIASEMNDLFLKLTEMLWEHISGSYNIASEKVSFSITEHYLVEFLGQESFASMSKLSRVFRVAPTTMTSIVDRLIHRGYLKRRRAEQDRRKVLVMLSEKGREFYLQHKYETLEIFSQYLSKLPDRGKRFRQSINEIRRNLDYLKKYLMDR